MAHLIPDRTFPVTAPTVSPPPPPRQPADATWLVYGTLCLVTAAVDLITKEIAFSRLGMPGMQPGWPVVTNLLWWETNLNEGALFGLGQGMGWLFVLVSAGALAGILATIARLHLATDALLVTALGLISGGIVGNLYDRLGLPGLTWHAPLERRGEAVYAVRDWIHFRLDGVIDWPIFNLADSFLVAGAGLLLLLSFLPPAPTSVAVSTPESPHD